MSGKLYLVGVGPGDPELLTLKAVRILASVAVVAYPVTGEGSAMAFDIAAGHLDRATERLPIAMPIAVDPAPAQAAYDAAAAAILDRLNAGLDVAYLCEGDPMLYGSAMYLLTRLAGQATIEIVPGITSLTAAAAAIARPLASRNDVLKVLPGPLPDDVLRRELGDAQSIAMIKVGRHFSRVRAVLGDAGFGETAMIVEHASGPRQRITRLMEFGDRPLPYFATILATRTPA